jgi:alpha-glucosidase
LDYLQELGVSALWISPIYPSPMLDFGYDISDYCGVDQLFGTLEDMDELIEAAHARGLKLILDFVPSHTSDQHPWFQESRASRDNPRRDWYLWHDGLPSGAPPNNWLSMFGGSGWQFDEHSGQYYLHTFLKEQPDLNWRNPQVRSTMYDVMRFWLDKGVDGFRVDVIYALLKDALLRDDPPNPQFKPGDNPYEALLHVHSLQSPGIHGILREMRGVLAEYAGDRVLIGETFHLSSLEQFTSYYGAQLDECHLPFNFQLIMLEWTPQVIRRFVEAYEAALPPGAWPNWVLGNHDQQRIATRGGGPAQARIAQMLLLTLRGTPTCYYGDEIGMTNVMIPPEREQDPYGLRVPGQGRDPVRTPMQWDNSPYAGFSTVEPWLPLADDARAVNVAGASGNPTSMLALFRRLIALRRASPALSIGSYATLATGQQEVYGYERRHEAERILVVLNFGTASQSLDLRQAAQGEVLLSTYLDRDGAEALGTVQLRPFEGLVIRC